MEGTVVLFVVWSGTTMRKCFLWGPIPGYITKDTSQPVVGGLVPLRFEEGRPNAVRDKISGKDRQQNY
jgi:hypothetical protein